MSTGPFGPLLGSGDWYQPQGSYGPWAGCGCSSLLIILGGLFLVCGGILGLFRM